MVRIGCKVGHALVFGMLVCHLLNNLDPDQVPQNIGRSSGSKPKLFANFEKQVIKGRRSFVLDWFLRT